MPSHGLTPDEAKAVLRWLDSGAAVTATAQQAADYRTGRDKLEAKAQEQAIARNREEQPDE